MQMLCGIYDPCLGLGNCIPDSGQWVPQPEACTNVGFLAPFPRSSSCRLLAVPIAQASPFGVTRNASTPDCVVGASQMLTVSSSP